MIIIRHLNYINNQQFNDLRQLMNHTADILFFLIEIRVLFSNDMISYDQKESEG